MSIPSYIQNNFKTMLNAACDGNLSIMECKDAVTGETRYVLCAVGRIDEDYVLTPFGHLAANNPFEAYIPPALNSPKNILPKKGLSHEL